MSNLFLLSFMFTTSTFLSPVWAEESPGESHLHIESIECRGNIRTECLSITADLFLSPGDALNEDEVENAKLRLASRTHFKNVAIRLEKGTERQKVRVVIEVEESNPIMTEVTAGANSYSARGGHLGSHLGSRVAHTNLFGKGKILAAEVEAEDLYSSDPQTQPNGFQLPTKELSKAARIQYADPNLFGGKEWFLNAVLETNRYSYLFDVDGKEEGGDDTFGIDVGRRIGDFSYLALHTLVNLSDNSCCASATMSDGSEPRTENKTSWVSPEFGFKYGWNSENDAYFPTQGSRFGLSMNWRSFQDSSSVANHSKFTVQTGYQNTWRGSDGAIWSFKFGNAPRSAFCKELVPNNGISLGYARDFKNIAVLDSIEKGRWYLDGGVGGFGYATSQGLSLPPQLKTGLRLQTKNFGIIDLYALVQGDSPRIGGEL